MSTAPAMPIFIDAYLADTTHLSVEEHGAYLLLLMAMWRRNGSVPNDDKDLARIVGLSLTKWRKIKVRILPFLAVDGDEISQKRLKKEWDFVQEKRRKNAENGGKGGRPKSKENNGIVKANGYLGENPDESTHTHTHTQVGSSDKSENLIDGVPADAGSPSSDDRYAFAASTIKLTGKDLEKWRQSFPHISLEAELWGLDDWAAQQRNWFVAVSGALAKKERAVVERIHMARVDREAGPSRRAIPDPRI